VNLFAYGLEDRNLLIRAFQTAYMNSLFPDTQRPSPESAGADVAVPGRESPALRLDAARSISRVRRYARCAG